MKDSIFEVVPFYSEEEERALAALSDLHWRSFRRSEIGKMLGIETWRVEEFAIENRKPHLDNRQRRLWERFSRGVMGTPNSMRETHKKLRKFVRGEVSNE